jgi:hypothetical protein
VHTKTKDSLRDQNKHVDKIKMDQNAALDRMFVKGRNVGAWPRHPSRACLMGNAVGQGMPYPFAGHQVTLISGRSFAGRFILGTNVIVFAPIWLL